MFILALAAVVALVAVANWRLILSGLLALDQLDLVAVGLELTPGRAFLALWGSRGAVPAGISGAARPAPHLA